MNSKTTVNMIMCSMQSKHVHILFYSCTVNLDAIKVFLFTN